MDLTYIVFTKHLEGLDVPQLIDALQAIGVQGADLCVRDGYPVNPDNVTTALPEAARRFADAGLCIPLVTAPGDFNRPDIDYAERYYAALGEAGVAHVKLGYWHWQPDVPYWTQLDEVRGFMKGFQALSEKYGVKTVIHNHSGASMGLNACAAMNIVKDCDPQYVGVFADPGHLSLCGEPIAMALDIVRSHLCLVALEGSGPPAALEYHAAGRALHQRRAHGAGLCRLAFGDCDLEAAGLFWPGQLSQRV